MEKILFGLVLLFCAVAVMLAAAVTHDSWQTYKATGCFIEVTCRNAKHN